MNKDIIFHINNMAYTINVDSNMEMELTKFLDQEKNNDTKDLLAAYIRITQEYSSFKEDINQLSNKLARF
ncbi:hypothetical protein [Poseidonibacter antarcticus]|uniref:hypothetical protein n=1 Tax=Poseidonibacter antarcticus TaxID=2478538 RepID=UPI000EF4BF0A|nr:hypothetical protein [Poseidonibacter antarcticus]